MKFEKISLIMNYTIFDTPVVNTLARMFSLFMLKLTGWKLEGKMPDIPKFVVIAAPHTSNWDLPYTLFFAFALNAKIYWMGKDALFRWPFGGVFKWLGGIPIDRSKSNSVVDTIIEALRKNEELILAVSPSGTRSKVAYWKTGFYHIANGANAPVVLGFLDYRRRAGGIGPVVYPTGDIEEDMKIIREFYSGITGKYPDKAIGTAAVRVKNSK